MRAFPALALASSALGLVVGCGAGSPLMHPVHPLSPNQVTMGAGTSHQLALGEADDQILSAERAAEPGGVAQTPGRRSELLRGAIAHTLSSPGLAPWVGARAGVGWDSDAGITYTGRAARVDARHVFVGDSVALSVGAGARGLLSRPGSDNGARSEPITGVDTGGVTGFGFDVPMLVGFRSDAELVQAYGGLRGDVERVFGDVLLRSADPAGDEVVTIDATRVGGYAVLGLMFGVSPIWVALEGSVGIVHGRGSYEVQNPTGTPERASSRFTAPVVSPAGALITRF